MLINRRQALQLGLAAFTGITATSLTKTIHSNDNPKRNFRVVGQSPLRKRAVARGFLSGAAGNYPTLSTDAALRNLFAQECSILVPENELKWDTLRPAIDKFDFSKGDWLAKFASTHRMYFRGHTLVWDQALPGWFKEKVNHQNAENILVEHITTTVKHYAGKVHSWDVVNEAIAIPYSNRPDGLHPGAWLELLGDGYIDLAFRTAAAADPKAMLVYNDRWLDYDTPRDNAQRAAVLKLLERFKSMGTPVQALGIQAHLDGSETRFNPRKLRTFLRDVASLGYKILITELDVVDKKLPVDIARRDRLVARAYEDYLSVVLDEKAVIAVLTWGLSDRATWHSNYNPRPDRAPVRPLPFDSNLKRKLGWNAMARAFDKAPKR
ncbi:MAG: endo-1,4-beta-xylanase [Cyanomargarita calcarea GSE-NOS-MK-12-04C]|jgi:endo-1,4-beta-xylanase|uniref:Beta-xylanase n=1 Tax=Cyanomargarita calcarea GSE-NOS-MK-12-04C TaxID=2839659 RepID=A0A951QU09_9CYAN|nr:endo-1,4-beta-xylanase [Cyanomargarita calcarea GSE-NOS-MK-12-04C]